jgi:hypothetical protein
MQTVFYESSSLNDHLRCQTEAYEEYIANLILLTQKYSVKLTPLKKARMLAISLHRNDYNLSRLIIENCSIDPEDIIMTCKILDAKRLYTNINAKIDKIKNKNKQSKHKATLTNLKALYEDINMSLTRSKIKFLTCEYFNKLTEQQLNYFILTKQRELWKKVIDLLHLKNTDFAILWFTKYVFSGEVPETSILGQLNYINQDNILDINKQFDLPINYLIKQHKSFINADVKHYIAQKYPISEIIINHKIIVTDITENIILDRLNAKEVVNIPYGELMKILVEIDNQNIKKKLINIADQQLNNYNLTIKPPVVVLGDASGSMQVAIETSIIIGSILCSASNAKMHLFRNIDEPINEPPRTVQSAIVLAKEKQANGGTIPAVSLFPYYERREKVNTFIIVTDEEEYPNYELHNGPFANLFKKYREEVCEAKLVFVSFLEGHKDGAMVRDLKEKIPNIKKDIIQFRLNSLKPDLRKMGNILDMMMISDETYQEQSQLMTEMIKDSKSFNVDELLNSIDTVMENSHIFSISI